jgi:hypothetical protein
MVYVLVGGVSMCDVVPILRLRANPYESALVSRASQMPAVDQGKTNNFRRLVSPRRRLTQAVLAVNCRLSSEGIWRKDSLVEVFERR